MQSSPNGFRANYLRERFPDVVVPALTPDVHERRSILASLIQPGAVLIGSSLGGLSALDFVRLYPERVSAMVLLAPAVGFHQTEFRSPEILTFISDLFVPAGIPTTVIAGERDEIVDIKAIEAMIVRSPESAAIDYHTVDDTHRLHSQACLDLMVEATKSYLSR